MSQARLVGDTLLTEKPDWIGPPCQGPTEKQIQGKTQGLKRAMLKSQKDSDIILAAGKHIANVGEMPSKFDSFEVSETQSLTGRELTRIRNFRQARNPNSIFGTWTVPTGVIHSFVSVNQRDLKSAHVQELMVSLTSFFILIA